MNSSSYPTRYGGYSNESLLGLFGSSSWNGMSYEARMDACQEVANRYAAANNSPAPHITAEPMVGSTYGFQHGGTVTLNEHMVRDGIFKTEDVDEDGKDILRDTHVSAANWNTLDTVFHEGTHAIQNSQGRLPGTYIDPDTEYDLYRIQSCEKEAFAAGQSNTLKAIDLVQRSTGEIDPEAAAYYTTVRNESFQAALQNAAFQYNDPNIEATLAQVIYDRDHSIACTSPSPSYAAINAFCDQCDVQSGRETLGGSTSSIGSPQENVDKASSGISGNGKSPDTSPEHEAGPSGMTSEEAESDPGTFQDDGGSLSAADSDLDIGLAEDGGEMAHSGLDSSEATEFGILSDDGGNLAGQEANVGEDSGRDFGGENPEGQDFD